MLIAGTWLLLNQQINVGQFIAVDIVIILIITSVEKLIASMDNVYDSLTSIEKIGKIVDNKIETNGNLPFDNSNGCSVSFEKVKFSYPNGSVGLNDVSINIESKKISCVKGKSGAGSSTILRLLTGAFPSFDGCSLLKMPDPTNTVSAPRILSSAASEGVAMPPAAKFGTGIFPSAFTFLRSAGGTRYSPAFALN